LLGAHDLEMLEIGIILEQHHIAYGDNKFEWGSKLSSYAELFDAKHTFVVVELMMVCVMN